jgi:hypothetical protein
MRNILYLVLFLLILICLYIWRFVESLSDFGLNLLTELIGIGITVFVIEKIIERNRIKDKLPVTAAAFSDISFFVNRYMSFFRELYRKSIDEPEPESIEKFLTLETYNKILENIDLTCSPAIFPQVDMTRYIYDNANNLIDLSDKILNRHGWHLHPLTYKHIHDIGTQSILMFWNNYIRNLSEFNRTNGVISPKVLKYYSIEITKEELDSILYLFIWCNQVSTELEGKFDTSFRPDYVVQDNEKDLSYKKDPEKLKIEIEIFNKGRE